MRLLPRIWGLFCLWPPRRLQVLVVDFVADSAVSMWVVRLLALPRRLVNKHRALRPPVQRNSVRKHGRAERQEMHKPNGRKVP